MRARRSWLTPGPQNGDGLLPPAGEICHDALVVEQQTGLFPGLPGDSPEEFFRPVLYR